MGEEREGLVTLGAVLVAIGLLWLVLTRIPWDVIAPLRPYALIAAGLAASVLAWATGRVGGNARVACSAASTAVLVAGFLFLAVALVQPLFTFPLAITPYTRTVAVNKTVSLDGARHVTLLIKVPNGDVSISRGGVGAVLISMNVKVFAASSEKLEEIAKPCVDVRREGDRLIITVYKPKIAGIAWYVVDLKVLVPEGVDAQATVDLGNGDVDVDGNYNKLSIDVGNGRVTLCVNASKLTVDVGNGIVEGEVSAASAALDVGHGEVSIRVPGRVSGSFDVDVSVGSIEVKVGGKAGYYIEASTSIGSASVDVRGVSEHGRKVKVATPGYEEAGIKVRLRLDVDVGSIEVEEG